MHPNETGHDATYCSEPDTANNAGVIPAASQTSQTEKHAQQHRPGGGPETVANIMFFLLIFVAIAALAGILFVSLQEVWAASALL